MDETDFLEHILKENGKTQKWLAEKLGFTSSLPVTQWKQKGEIPSGRIKEIEKLLSVNWDDEYMKWAAKQNARVIDPSMVEEFKKMWQEINTMKIRLYDLEGKVKK